MKKRIAFRKLGRTTSHRWSMFRNQVSSLIEHERIVTTLPKAKELRRIADQMITLAKGQDLHNRRRAAEIVRGQWNLTKLFDILGPRYQLREGGYTRVLKLAKNRAGDNAPMAVIEYVDRPGEVRAARPPRKLQDAIEMYGLEEALRKMGIPAVDDLVDETEKQAIQEKLNKESSR